VRQDQIDRVINQSNKYFEDEFQASKTFEPSIKQTRDPNYRGSRSLTHKWKDMAFSQDGIEPSETGFDTDKLHKIAQASVEIPASFSIHPRLQKMHISNR